MCSVLKEKRALPNLTELLLYFPKLERFKRFSCMRSSHMQLDIQSSAPYAPPYKKTQLGMPHLLLLGVFS